MFDGKKGNLFPKENCVSFLLRISVFYLQDCYELCDLYVFFTYFV